MTSVSNTTVSIEKPKRLNQYLGAVAASLGSFAIGVNLGWTSFGTSTLMSIGNASDGQIGTVAVIPHAGGLISLAVLPFVLSFDMSRPTMMLFTIPISLIGWAFVCFADQLVWLVIIGRIICGFSVAIFCSLTPVFIGEIADTEVRGRLLMLHQLLVNCGIMYAYVIGFVLEESESLWRLSLICAVACAPIALVNLIPESPLYHVIRDDKNAARRSLEWYRGEEYKLEDELEELHILAKAMKSPLTSLDFLKRRKLRRALLVSTLATAVQQLCGVTPFVTLSLLFFDNMDSGDMTSGDQTLVVGAVQILSSVLAIFLVDRLGRKILLTVSSAAVALCLCLLGFYYKWRDEDPQICDDYPWASPLLVVLFFFFFNLGLGPIPSAMLGDSFPVQVRQSCANRVAFFGHGITILMMILCGVVVIQLGLSHLLWTYCVFTWAGAALFCVFVEETRGRSLLDLQREQVFEVPETSEENETAEI